MLGQGGWFRQENTEKRKWMSIREWAELCSRPERRAPGVEEVGTRSGGVKRDLRRAKKATVASPDPEGTPDLESVIKEEPPEEDLIQADEVDEAAEEKLIDSSSKKRPMKGKKEQKEKTPRKRTVKTKEEQDASAADKHAKDMAFLDTFEPHTDWLPPGTTPEDYTFEFCQKLERQYWRNLGLGTNYAWYGADGEGSLCSELLLLFSAHLSPGSLFTDQTTSWNVANLDSAMTRLLPQGQRIPGVNTPYLYWGMWRATFAWHVEDMDLFSINYIHFGAPKFWYAVPQGKAGSLENAMRSMFSFPMLTTKIL
jgi:hypothetical protein